MGLAGEVRGGGYTIYIQPSGGGEGKGVARENTGLNTHRKGGGREIARINTIYMYKQRLFSIWFHCFLIIII